MQYFLSKEAMRCPDKVTALHLLTHRIAFFSLTAHLPVMLNSFQHLTASLSCSSPRTDPEICG
jgi:hypothetical protein